MRDVTPITKEAQTGRVWSCTDPSCTRTKPCASHRGRRNRRKGQREQSSAVKELEAQTGAIAKWRGRRGNEETCSHLPVRVEVKSGAKANVVLTQYLAAESQAESAKAIGDPRPFLAAFRPDGITDTLWIFRGSRMAAVVDALTPGGD